MALLIRDIPQRVTYFYILYFFTYGSWSWQFSGGRNAPLYFVQWFRHNFVLVSVIFSLMYVSSHLFAFFFISLYFVLQNQHLNEGPKEKGKLNLRAFLCELKSDEDTSIEGLRKRLMEYFQSKFPKLLMHTYSVMSQFPDAMKKKVKVSVFTICISVSNLKRKETINWRLKKNFIASSCHS